MKVWLRQHGFALAHALRHMLKPRSGFLVNAVVVAIALALPFAGLTLLENIRPVSEQLAIDPEISVFLAVDTPADKATGLASAIRRMLQESKYTAKVEFIPRDKALNLLKEKTAMAEAIATLGSNPLPDAFLIKFGGAQNASSANRLEALATQLKTLPGVEHVQIDSVWIKRLAALMQVLQTALLLLAAALGAVVVAVVFNTIRLQVMNQREEIEVSRLVGATDAFICRPFYYAGALLGLGAGGLALGMVAIGLHPLNEAIADFARLYASEFRLAPLGPAASGVLLAFSALLGLTGSLLSVNRHLARLTKPS